MPELNEVIRDILKTNGIHAYCDSTDFVPNLSDHKVSIGGVDYEIGELEIKIDLPKCVAESMALKHIREIIKILVFNADRIGLNKWSAYTEGYTGYTSDAKISYVLTLYCNFPE